LIHFSNSNLTLQFSTKLEHVQFPININRLKSVLCKIFLKKNGKAHFARYSFEMGIQSLPFLTAI